MLNFKDFLNIPEEIIKGKIYKLKINSNPIEILLDNGSKLFLTKKQFEIIKGKKLDKGDKVEISLQKSGTSKNDKPFKINYIKKV